MVKNTWDKDDARRCYREDAARYGDRLLEIALSMTLLGKTGRLKRQEKYYWNRSIEALCTHLGVQWGVPAPTKALPMFADEMKQALYWAFCEFWPNRGVDIWLDDEFESFVEPDEDSDD